MPALRHSLRVAAADLPSAVPGVWPADALCRAELGVQPTGFEGLDAQLPGGGWPVGALSEVLQPLAGLHEWQLVLPALAGAAARRAGAAVVVAPPCEPFGPALQAQGLPAGRWCVVRADGAAALWAAEQALRCWDVMAVMAWLPQVQPAALRRLHLAAAQQQQLLWVFRPAGVAPQSSPAMLRLQVEGTTLAGGASAAPGLRVRILKRRGPPLAQALDLPGCPARLAQALAAQAARRRAAQAGVAVGAGLATAAAPGAAPGAAGRGRGLADALATPAGLSEGAAHALDRIALAVVR